MLVASTGALLDSNTRNKGSGSVNYLARIKAQTREGRDGAVLRADRKTIAFMSTGDGGKRRGSKEETEDIENQERRSCGQRGC